ncbi:unnamed protein product [Prorocentrum cordatum]|uniref:Subtilisin n=1 Tax=Prorocentrum cordatum TaxID=2364126 RepID=A0ABN9UER7_9DINO|nr:unnamed protein product [Polarella glacialis]
MRQAKWGRYAKRRWKAGFSKVEPTRTTARRLQKCAVFAPILKLLGDSVKGAASYRGADVPPGAADLEDRVRDCNELYGAAQYVRRFCSSAFGMAAASKLMEEGASRGHPGDYDNDPEPGDSGSVMS